MASRLADDVLASIGNSSPVRLRACLRAAIRLDRRYGMEGLLAGIRDGNLSLMSAIINEIADDDPQELFDHMQVEPLRVVITTLRSVLLPIVEQMIGLDDDAGNAGVSSSSTPSSSSSATWEGWQDYYGRLFGIATGWLGWSPEDAYDATPAEILAAYKGRQEMIGTILKAVFGPGEEDQADAPNVYEPQLNEHGMDPAFDRAALHALKARLG